MHSLARVWCVVCQNMTYENGTSDVTVVNSQRRLTSVPSTYDPALQLLKFDFFE